MEEKTFLNYTNLFSPNDYKSNDKIIYKYFEDKYVKFRLTQKIVETRTFLLEEIKHDDLMCEKSKKTCKYLNYVEHLLVLTSAITSCVSISPFASLVCVLVGITISAVGLNICAIITESKKCKSIIKKKKKKHDKIVLLGIKVTIKFLISKALIDSCISHDKSVSVKNVLREYNETKEEIKKSWNFCRI